jgi:PKD repeat protein
LKTIPFQDFYEKLWGNKQMMKRENLVVIATVLIVLTAVMPAAVAAGNGTICEQGATIFIGEQGLNVTHALKQANTTEIITPAYNDSVPILTRIGWWTSAGALYDSGPSKTMDLGTGDQYKSLYADQSQFVGYTGNWYLLNASGTGPVHDTPEASLVFSVQDPALNMAIRDFSTGSDVNGMSVPQGEKLGFRIETNMYPAVDSGYRGPVTPETDGYIDIKIKDPSDTTITELYNQSAADTADLPGPYPVLNNFVNEQPFSWGHPLNGDRIQTGNVWDTGALDLSSQPVYPAGTYTIFAESTLNHMRDNYQMGGADYTWKTVSPAYTVTLTPPTDAEFHITRDSVIESNNDSLASGMHDGFIMNSLYIRHVTDGSGIAFGHLNFSISTKNLTWIDWDQYADWNDTAANWNFPDGSVLYEGDSFGVTDATSIPVHKQVNMSLNRWFNQTRFNSTGYQLVRGNVTLTDNTSTTNMALSIDWPFPSVLVNATIVPGSFTTDAPVVSSWYSDYGINVWLDKPAMEPGKTYNFSAEYRVEPNGTPIKIKPFMSVTIGTFDNISAGPSGYRADLPSFLLPENVTYASVSTDTHNTWQFAEHRSTVVRLNQKVNPLPVANFTASPLSGTAPLTVQFNDTSAGFPSSWNWTFGDDSLVNATERNPVHTYAAAGTYTVSLNATNGTDYNIKTMTGYISVTAPGSTSSRIGVVRSNTTWLLDKSGDGKYGVGDLTYSFGKAGDVPVTGDWDADGAAEIGVVRSGTTWLLDKSGDGKYGAGDLTYSFGKAGDKPVTGDWDADIATEIGVVRSNTTWLLDKSGDGKYGAGDLTYSFGKAGDVPVTGDWDADGAVEIGVVRSNTTWLLDKSGDGKYGAGDLTYSFGKAGDKPVTGDWDADITTEIGVVRSNTSWLLDKSGDGKYGAGDLTYTFGKAGDVPVTGKWA